MILEGFGGPGGWSTGARMIGLTDLVGIELDEAACLTRAAAGHRTIRADITGFPVHRLAGKVTGAIFSPECTTFSAAGGQAGNAVTAILADLIRDLWAGRPTRARRRNEMARALRDANWPPPKMRKSRYCKDYKTPVRLTRAQRSAAIRKAVFSAALVAEPARFLAACLPEWVALEQVPAVLPLWQVYAEELRKLGYSVWCGKLNAANYGVPQTRERAILIASRVRRVSCPTPTHYDPRGGEQLFGEPWISMAAALGWGATARPVPTVTAGGTATGGAEPFGHRDRDALQAEQDAGRWALRSGNQDNAAVRDATAPAPAMSFGHASADCQWVLRMDTQEKATLPRSVDEPAPTIQFAHRSNLARWVRTSYGDPSGERTGTHEMDPCAPARPAHTVTSKTRNWTVESAGEDEDLRRELHTNRDQRPDGTRQVVDPPTALTAKSGGQWVVKSFRNNNNNNACQRSLDEPAGTLFFGGRSNWAAWQLEREDDESFTAPAAPETVVDGRTAVHATAVRPSTTVQGDPRIGRPGHKDRDQGEAQFAQESVRITVEEAAILQSFPADYPWQGSQTKRFEQVGNAVPPRLAAAILGEAAGIDWQPLVTCFYGETEAVA